MASRELLRKLNLKNPWHLLAVGFGSGLAPKAPGTFGSLAAIPICMVLLYIDPAGESENPERAAKPAFTQ